MSRALIEPAAVPTSTAASTDTDSEAWFDVTAKATAPSPQIDPTDRSNPPQIMTHVMPTAMMARAALSLIMLRRLVGVRNVGETSCATMMRTMNAQTMPYFKLIRPSPLARDMPAPGERAALVMDFLTGSTSCAGLLGVTVFLLASGFLQTCPAHKFGNCFRGCRCYASARDVPESA